MLWQAAGVRAPRQIPPRDREPWKQLKDKSQEPINTRALLTDSVSGHIKAPRCLLAAREGIMLVAVKGKCNLTLNLCCNWLISRRLGKITPGHDWLEEFLLSYFSLPTMVVLTSGVVHASPGLSVCGDMATPSRLVLTQRPLVRKNTALLKPLNLSWGFSASADRASGAGGSWLCGAWPRHYRRLNSILDLDSLDANSNSPPCCDNPKCFQTLPNVPWGQYHPRLRATSLIRCPVCHGLSSPWWRLTIFQQPFLLDQWPT